MNISHKFGCRGRRALYPRCDPIRHQIPPGSREGGRRDPPIHGRRSQIDFFHSITHLVITHLLVVITRLVVTYPVITRLVKIATGVVPQLSSLQTCGRRGTCSLGD